MNLRGRCALRPGMMVAGGAGAAHSAGGGYRPAWTVLTTGVTLAGDGKGGADAAPKDNMALTTLRVG